MSLSRVALNKTSPLGALKGPIGFIHLFNGGCFGRGNGGTELQTLKIHVLMAGSDPSGENNQSVDMVVCFPLFTTGFSTMSGG